MAQAILGGERNCFGLLEIDASMECSRKHLAADARQHECLLSGRFDKDDSCPNATLGINLQMFGGIPYVTLRPSSQLVVTRRSWAPVLAASRHRSIHWMDNTQYG
jgi:hypothetical protein